MANILIRINEAENTAQAIGNTRARHMSWISSTHTLLYKEVSNPDDKFDSGIPMFLPSLIGNGMGLRVTQAQHGFELWTPVRYDYANNDWKGALADNGENLAVGIVVNIIGQDTFDIAFFGSYDVGESSLPQGTLFLSPSNAGKYSGTSAPTSGIPQIVAHRTGSKLVVCPTSGIRGADGKRGPAGPQGLPGVDGSDGSEWISGSGAPSASIGRVGSFYLDYDLANVFEKTVEGWQFRVNLKGPKGDGSSSIAWSSIDGKPLAFPPTAHAHTWSDIQGLGDALEGLNTDKLSKSGGTIEGDLLVTQGRVYRPIDPSLMEVNDWQWGFDTDNPNPGAGFEARLQAGIWKDSDGTVMPGLRAYGSMMLYDPRTDRWGCNYQAFAYQSDLSDLIPSSQKGVANGLATLDSSGVIPVSQLPPIVITDTFQVSSESAMLALVAQRGDVCVRSDLSKTFILAAEPASTLANWVQILTPTNSVNGSMTSGKIPKATGSGTLADSLLEDTGTSIIANGLFTVKNADLSVDMLSDNYVGIWYKKYGQKDFFIHTEQNVEKRDLIFSTYNDSGVWDSVALRIARLPTYPNVSGRHFVPKITNTYDLGSDTLRWAALHATSIYRDGTEIGSLFAASSHTQDMSTVNGLTDSLATISSNLALKRDNNVYSWVRGAIGATASWAKIVSTILTTDTNTYLRWSFYVRRAGSTRTRSPRIGILNIGWYQGTFQAEYINLSGIYSTVKFGYTGGAYGSLFEVFCYCTQYPYLELEVIASDGGVVLGGAFSTADPGMTDIATYSALTDNDGESKHTRGDIDANTNWNTLIWAGTYRQTGGTLGANGPIGAYGYGLLEVFAKDSVNTRCVQCYYPFRTDGSSQSGFWMRVAYDGTFLNWQRIIDRGYADTIYALIGGSPSFNSISVSKGSSIPAVYNGFLTKSTTTGTIICDMASADEIVCTAKFAGDVLFVFTNLLVAGVSRRITISFIASVSTAHAVAIGLGSSIIRVTGNSALTATYSKTGFVASSYNRIEIVTYGTTLAHVNFM